MITEKLYKLEQESISRGIPILGSVKGTWLYHLVKELKPQKILELGTANGYSGIIMGSEGAELTTIELNPEIAEEAKANFKEYKIKAKVIIGDAVEEIKKLNENFDLIFIDFAKRKYIEVLEKAINLLNKNGVIVADNITMEGCKDFKERVLNHPKLKTEIINIKDGLGYSQLQ
ncbi:MAG: O-methyltransferase [Candidatus Nanoarchaeia archaeon]|nr:O-methyltransferase [Candidatus Nanoarchaeia archaeon]